MGFSPEVNSDQSLPLVIACTGFENPKRLHTETLLPDNLVASAKPKMPEWVFNGLDRPDYIAGLKLVQVINTEDILGMLRGVISAELVRRKGLDPRNKALISDLLRSADFQQSLTTVIDQVINEGGFILTATDIQFRSDHPSFTVEDINQPEVDTTDKELRDQLFRYMVRNPYGSSDQCLIPGQLEAGLGVLWVGVEKQTENKGSVSRPDWREKLALTEIEGKLGRWKVPFFYYQTMTETQLDTYIERFGQRARSANSGLLWEELESLILIIDGCDRDSEGFFEGLTKIREICSGVPNQLANVVASVRKAQYTSTLDTQLTKAMIDLIMTKLGRCTEVSERVVWRPWYPQ